MDIPKILVKFLDGLREYVRESNTNIAHDIRESKEFVDIFLNDEMTLFEEVVEYEILVTDENKTVEVNQWIPISTDRIQEPHRIDEYIEKGILRKIKP